MTLQATSFLWPIRLNGVRPWRSLLSRHQLTASYHQPPARRLPGEYAGLELSHRLVRLRLHRRFCRLDASSYAITKSFSLIFCCHWKCVFAGVLLSKINKIAEVALFWDRTSSGEFLSSARNNRTRGYSDRGQGVPSTKDPPTVEPAVFTSLLVGKRNIFSVHFLCWQLGALFLPQYHFHRCHHKLLSKLCLQWHEPLEG